jgi:hypothetical protein
MGAVTNKMYVGNSLKDASAHCHVSAKDSNLYVGSIRWLAKKATNMFLFCHQIAQRTLKSTTSSVMVDISLLDQTHHSHEQKLHNTLDPNLISALA